MRALSILWSLTGHCYKVRHNNDRSIHPDPSLRWETGAREYNFCTAHNRPPQQQHSITVVCLLFCINHWKNCIVWHRTHSNINSSAKLIAYGRRRRIIHLAYGKKEKKEPKGRRKLNAPKVVITCTTFAMWDEQESLWLRIGGERMHEWDGMILEFL